MMCNGATIDEYRFHIHGLVERVGWAVVPVDARRPANSWAYTVGLASRGHPELIVVGRGPEAAGRLLNALARRMELGEPLGPGDVVQVGTRRYRLAPVDLRHFTRGVFAVWVDYYRALGEPRPTPSALEVIPEGQAERVHLVRC